MLELRENRAPSPQVHGGPTAALLPVRNARSYGKHVLYLYGKRKPESVERVPMIPRPVETRTTHSVTDTLTQSYVTFEPEELSSLYYFELKIHHRIIVALVDSGSNRTLLG
jgi:hypothetical protein